MKILTGFLILLTALLSILKFVGLLAWKWVWVLAPLWGPIIIASLVIAVGYCIVSAITLVQCFFITEYRRLGEYRFFRLLAKMEIAKQKREELYKKEIEGRVKNVK